MNFKPPEKNYLRPVHPVTKKALFLTSKSLPVYSATHYFLPKKLIIKTSSVREYIQYFNKYSRLLQKDFEVIENDPRIS